MARLALNKSSLTHQNQQLKAFKQFLPALDLKRRQLLAEQGKARQALVEAERKQQELAPLIQQELPMLANLRVDLTGLVTLTGVDLVEENVMGTRLPRLKGVQVKVRNYGLLAKPHWVDRVVESLKIALELRIGVQVAQQRLTLLGQAVRTITQRVNLFDKVLIPRTQANIKKIQIYLSDADRAGVVQAKLAKAKKRNVT
jgi:V/A-type H+-transporting ATPase subunit D